MTIKDSTMNTVTLGNEHLVSTAHEKKKLTKHLVSRKLTELTKDKSLDDKIADFKEQVINYALEFMEKDAKYADVKEVKDVVGMVSAIEPKIQSQQTTNVNVLVQTLSDRFTDDV